MRESFKKQIEGNGIVTAESLAEFENKIYHSGREIQIGDIILYGLLYHPISVDDMDFGNGFTVELINEQDFDLYIPCEECNTKLLLPAFKLKESL